jgi:hypothetical protein
MIEEVVFSLVASTVGYFGKPDLKQEAQNFPNIGTF